ncbi:MAG: ABC transporter ATP-binding protein, partial [Treponema sp.]|nr:ABC transporter ATP-binding protein [Treponema sp.]
EVFLFLCKNQNVTILFSTHITSDLDKCANNIIYIKEGKIINSSSKDDFLKTHNDTNLENIMINIEKVKYEDIKL